MNPRPCIVLLPGLLCDATVWRGQREALSFADCIVPSYGQLATLTDMASAVLQLVPAQRFALAGHSMGGRVALEIARLAPQRVQRLALLDSGVQPLAGGAAGEQERASRQALLELARTAGMRAMGERWARGMVHPQQLDTPLFGEILDMIERQTPAIFEAQIQALLARPDAQPVLDAFDKPLLIGCGRQDGWSPLSRHEEMHARHPAAQLVVFEHCGHMATMEQAAAVAQALRAFMQ